MSRPDARLCPFAVLNLPTFEQGGFTEEQLRYNYKVLARQLHPDKRPRDMTQQQATSTFQVLTDAYRTLLHELERRRSDRTYLELRAPYVQQQQQQQQQQQSDEQKPSKRFNLQRFNAVFDENRLLDPVFDHGYGKWMEQTDADRDAQRRQRQLITRDANSEPQPTAIITGRSLVQYSELGARAVQDYSRGGASDSKRAIPYSDYRLAHTTAELATDDELRAGAQREAELSRYRNPAAVQKMRASTLTFEMTPEDAQAEAERRLQGAREEEERGARLRAYDRMIGIVHDRTSRMLIGNA